MNPVTGFAETERSRIPSVEVALPGITQSGFDSTLAPNDLGSTLWCQHVGAADDRALYWQRLAILQRLIEGGASEDELNQFEDASRGVPVFDDSADLKVLVTGFDPFHLDTNIHQTNPSGVVALQLDDQRVSIGTSTAQIRTAIFPVRFKDFDEGTVEHRTSSLIDSKEVDMIISVSMGRDQFDLERFPGRRRSSPNPDNERLHGGGNFQEPAVPSGLEQTSEFVEFSLPVAAMRSVGGQYQVRDNRSVTTLDKGDIEADSLTSLEGQIAVQGGGGGYLSNEISYRLVRLCQGTGIPVGHIHTPKLQGYDRDQLEGIVDQCQQLILAAIKTLPDA